MKKISKTVWNRYKESAEGKEVIALFKNLCSDDCTTEDMLNVAKRFNLEYFKNSSEKDLKAIRECLDFYDGALSDIISNNDLKIEKGEDFVIFFYNFLHSLFPEGAGDDFDELPQSGFKALLAENMMMSIVLYAYLPSFFIPNFFVMQFACLKKFAEKYDVELPKIPNRSDYRERCLYYLDLCIAIVNFAVENGIDDSAEICAFIYGCELPIIKDELEAEYDKPMPKVPEQAWILVGNYGEGEKNMKRGFWQANQLTCKGDIMLFYEKSPVKKLNSVWIALEDGVIDPFFHYYSHTYIGQKIEIPADKAITFEDFKNSEYFKVENRGREGNFVSKNFQDVSGWEVTSDDYAEIKRMLEAKGFDTSILPSLYEPKKLTGVDISLEADVSEKLLVPLLEEMGKKRNEDFKAEVEFPAGHSTTGHRMEKRPDFCLHLSGSGSQLTAKVVIEVKYWMRDNIEVEQAFDQGVTYAKWGEAKVLVLCDKNQIRVYERNKKGKFDKDKRSFFRWEDMENLERFNELKRLLDL